MYDVSKHHFTSLLTSLKRGKNEIVTFLGGLFSEANWSHFASEGKARMVARHSWAGVPSG